MNETDESVRELREQLTVMQWTLAGVLKNCHDIGSEVGVNPALLQRLTRLKLAVQNLDPSLADDPSECRP
jgi:hypothetical protein